MYLILALCLSARAGVVVEAGELAVETSSADTLAQARTAFDSGKFDEAAALYGALADAGGGARARVAQAVALYESGYVRAARAAAERALATSPKDFDALNLLGLALVDGGAVDAGIEKLESARKLAASSGNTGGEARALVNLGLAWLDRGEKEKASAAFTAAQPLAQAAGDARTLRAVADGLAAVAALGGTEAGVGNLLGKGQTSAARTAAVAAQGKATTRRERLNADLDLAAVERAEGKLDAASGRLGRVVKEARETGMSRELAVGLGSLGLVESIGGRLPLAADTLLAAAQEAKAGGYRVIEVDTRCELGLVYAHLGRLDEADAQQRAAGTLLAGMAYPQGMARQAELGGAVAAARGDLTTASDALASAYNYFIGLGRQLDAARAATTLAAAWQTKDRAKADSWGKKATDAFARAGEPLGPAHVTLARALADGRAKNLDAALAGFAKAAELAEATGGGQATALARIAREDAAQTLVLLGHDRDIAALASQQGLSDIVARSQKLEAGSDAYDEGLAAYNAGQFDTARQRFVAARLAFEALGETAYADRARRAATWAVYNQLATLPTAKAAPSWQAVVEEAAKVDDPELYARTYGAAVLAAHQTGQKDLRARMDECVRLAGNAGLTDIASRCHGAIAEAEGDLDDRANHARLALLLTPTDPATAYSLYNLAVDAYNGGRNELALEMGKAALPHAGGLTASVQQVIDAAGAP